MMWPCGVPAALELVVPQRRFAGEAGLLVGALGARVLGPDLEPDALEAELGKAEVDDGTGTASVP